jgi:hypothetical protein
MSERTITQPALVGRHRQEPYSAEQAIAGMDEAGVATGR